MLALPMLLTYVKDGCPCNESRPDPAAAMPSFCAISPRPLSAPPLLRVTLFTPARASFTKVGLMVLVQFRTPFAKGAVSKVLYTSGKELIVGVSWRPFE